MTDFSLLNGLHRVSTRRQWLTQQSALFALSRVPGTRLISYASQDPLDAETEAQFASHAALFDPATAEQLVKRAVEAATSAGATYADARITRAIQQRYDLIDPGLLFMAVETLGIGVRALVNGYWGFAASTILDGEEAARLGQEASAAAAANTGGPSRPVELLRIPVAQGRWSTPIQIDPFAVSLEEKAHLLNSLPKVAQKHGFAIELIGTLVQCSRQERVVATSEGSLFSQTLYESGAKIPIGVTVGDSRGSTVLIPGLDVSGRGWESFLEIPPKISAMGPLIEEADQLKKQERPALIGAYDLVCDGATMAAMLEPTLGRATQLDRALGYEANAGGTSYFNDPLAMIGTVQATSPLVTITADRSQPRGLATVKWDDEGVAPDTATLIKAGVLNDFQTTRESATWLQAYYAKAGIPVRSHGHAVASSALNLPLQQMPNLALAPSAVQTHLTELIGTVTGNGIFVEQGTVQVDVQGKTGLLFGKMRKIANGRLGPPMTGGAIRFNSADFWQKVRAIGGPATQMTIGNSAFQGFANLTPEQYPFGWRVKGQPPQLSSSSTQAPAAVIAQQPVIVAT